MITTSNGVKLKAFKNGRDTEDVKEAEVEKCKASDKGGDEENCSSGAGSNTDHNNPLHTIVICQRDRPDNRLKSRPRTRDDFRMARGGAMDRRGASIRSRGVSRKVERENETNIVSTGKFQDSLSKANAGENVSSSKYYNDSEVSKHRIEFGYMVPEDSRISKLLRRLSREDDQDKFMTLCKQLQESLMVPENGRYIRRSLDLIVESLLDLLHSGPGPDAKFQAAKCLGRVGYVLEQDFKRYVDWMFSTYAIERNEEVRLLLMKAVLETLKLDEETLKLKEFSSMLMNNLQNALEYTDLPEFLIGTVDVILQLTEMYPSTFTKHFRDTVDILVGWHIDGTQKCHITNYASRSLQRLSRFWVADMQFSLTLLSQFLEDMEAYGEDLTLPSSGRSSPTDEPPLTPEQCVAKITSLIKPLNSI